MHHDARSRWDSIMHSNVFIAVYSIQMSTQKARKSGIGRHLCICKSRNPHPARPTTAAHISSGIGRCSDGILHRSSGKSHVGLCRRRWLRRLRRQGRRPLESRRSDGVNLFQRPASDSEIAQSDTMIARARVCLCLCVCVPRVCAACVCACQCVTQCARERRVYVCVCLRA